MIRVMFVATALLMAASVHAEEIVFEAELSGQAEVPPNDATGTGSATARFDTETLTFSWDIRFSGTTGPLIGGHVHGPAGTGENAGVMLPLSPLESPMTGSATLTEAQAADLLAGRTYINLHTEAHPGGELRGQLVPMQ